MNQTFENLKEFLHKAFADKNAFAITYSIDTDNHSNSMYHMKYTETRLCDLKEEEKDVVLVADTNRILNAIERLGNDYEFFDPVITQTYDLENSEVITDFSFVYFD